MRSRVPGAVVLLAAMLLIGSCGKPAGVDGNLTNQWAPMPEATVAVPNTGSCYNVTTDDPSTVTKWPAAVPCTAPHTVETAFVGTFTGPDAERESAPGSGSTGRKSAYGSCMSKATELLGGDWRGGRLDLSLVLPITAQWQAGARWYRCDLMEYKDLDDYQVVTRTTGLAGGLAGDRPVGLGCFTVTEKDNKIDKMTPIGCEQPHNGEYAGIYEQPDGNYPADEAAKNARLAGCAAVIAGFAAVPNDTELQSRIGWISFPFTELDWGLGNRGVRCYAHADSTLTGTLRGAGPSKLPVD